MKKSILIILISLSFMSVYSQTEKGKMFVGGLIDYYSYRISCIDSLNKNDLNYKKFQFIPVFGYFITNNFAIGLNINFGTYSDTQSNSWNSPYITTRKTKSITYGGGGFARYYCKIVDKFFFILNGGITYTSQPEKLTYSHTDPSYVFPSNSPANQDIQNHITDCTLAPGLIYFITPKLGIQIDFGKLYYTNSTSKNTTFKYAVQNNQQISGINLNSSTFHFGLSYYF
jgi:hypothetical protein